MIDKVLEGFKPFALTLVIFAGASMAGWVKFSNGKYVGYALVFFGVFLVIDHIVARTKDK